jgi:hypothetical protein
MRPKCRRGTRIVMDNIEHTYRVALGARGQINGEIVARKEFHSELTQLLKLVRDPSSNKEDIASAINVIMSFNHEMVAQGEAMRQLAINKIIAYEEQLLEKTHA